MSTLIVIAALGIIAGYLIKHFATAAQLASIESTLQEWEGSAVAEIKSIIADIRAKL